MITIGNEFASSGRNLGNKLFTYGVSKIIADAHKYALNFPKPSYIQRNGVISSFPFFSNDGIRINEPSYYVSDRSMYELGINTIIEQSKNKNTFIDGYFIRYEYVKNHKDKLLKIYETLIETPDNKNDVIILLRDSNADSTFKLPDDYYTNILDNMTFDNLYISFDHEEKHRTLISKLEKYNPTLLDLPILDLFKFITSKKTIIGCQGTFSFWGCWLSNAEKIYWPLTTKGPNLGDWSVNLTVDDEERYVFINVDNKLN
jgi:hypothetical protein